MANVLGQSSSIWDNFWKGITPLSEIRMWDYYGGRQWITKYVPRFGKVIEAGCGLGRYVFYLRKLGIDIDGIDFSESVIENLNNIKSQIEPEAFFALGDVTKLPYDDNSLSGYISLGVVEHFIEGPMKPIAEAYRVLRPGGIAIITTPNKSFYIRYRNIKQQLKRIIKKIIGKKTKESDFFQYEYSPKQLSNFCKEQGFFVSRAEGCDLLYPFTEIGGFTGSNIQKSSFAYWFANTFENTFIKYFGAQSITILVKVAPLMYCFLSGKLNTKPESLKKYDVPISDEMQNNELAKLFLKGNNVKYAEKYMINPPLLEPETRFCKISGKEYITDEIFEDFGFNINVHPELLKEPSLNIDISVKNIKPIWRKR